MREWLLTIQGVNLAIWGVIIFGTTSILKLTDPEKIVLALGGGLIGYISGYAVGRYTSPKPPEAAQSISQPTPADPPKPE